MKTIKLEGPNWQAAVRIYVACLLNPNAGHEAHQSAEADLLRLAKFADAKIDEKKSIESLGDIKRQAE